MPSYLLDTNILIGCLRGHPRTTSLWRTLQSEGELCISSITYLEVIAGIRPQEESLTYELLMSVTPFPLDNAVADQAGRLIVRHRSMGLTLELADAAVAATAILYGLTLVTYNTKDFPMLELRLYPLPDV